MLDAELVFKILQDDPDIKYCQGFLGDYILPFTEAFSYRGYPRSLDSIYHEIDPNNLRRTIDFFVDFSNSELGNKALAENIKYFYLLACAVKLVTTELVVPEKLVYDLTKLQIKDIVILELNQWRDILFVIKLGDSSSKETKLELKIGNRFDKLLPTGVKADMYVYKYFNGKSFKSAYLPVALEDISKTTIGQLFKDLDK